MLFFRVWGKDYPLSSREKYGDVIHGILFEFYIHALRAGAWRGFPSRRDPSREPEQTMKARHHAPAARSAAMHGAR